MRTKILTSLTTVLLLAGCSKDVNLAKDVDFMVNTPIPTEKPVILGTQSTPTPTLPPTPKPSVAPSINPQSSEPASVSGKQADTLVDLSTSKGTIRLKLYGTKAPKTVANFLQKAKSNYYQNLTFHRVESWVIQGGDPLGNGTGGGKMATELNQEPFKTGSLGVARGGDITVSNDSQFFICTTDCSWLTGAYTNFGEVVSGMEVAQQIAIGDKILSLNPIP